MFFSDKKKYSSTVSSTIQEENEHHSVLSSSSCFKSQAIVEVKKNELMREAIRSVMLVRDKTGSSSLRRSSLQRRINQKTVKLEPSRDVNNNNTIVYEKQQQQQQSPMDVTDGKSLAALAAAGGVKPTGSMFLVDYASTPIKLAPKTSTPKKT
jgi:hypothetical protein